MKKKPRRKPVTIQTGSKISPCLWFDNQAEEAARFYVSLFKNSRVGDITHYGDGAPMPRGTVLTVRFHLAGQEFVALNGGPIFKFSEAVSFIVYCNTQKELDRYWDKLSEGGAKVQCGWLKDRYGLSWQIVLTILAKMLTDPDASRADRVMQAVLQMKKLDIQAIKQAYRR